MRLVVKEKKNLKINTQFSFKLMIKSHTNAHFQVQHSHLEIFYLCLFIRSFIELSGHLLSPRYVQALGQAWGHCGVRFAVGWGTQPEGMRGTVWVLLLWVLSRAGGADEPCSPWGGLGRLPGGKLGPGG